MHMNALSYDEFAFFGDILYETGQRSIYEKILYLSISFFTLATELRFLEIDR